MKNFVDSANNDEMCKKLMRSQKMLRREGKHFVGYVSSNEYIGKTRIMNGNRRRIHAQDFQNFDG